MAARNFLILFCFFSHSALTWATLPYCGSDSYKYTPLQRGDNGKEYTLKQVHVIIRWVLIHAFVQNIFFFSPIFRIFYKIYIKLFPRVLIFLKFGCGIFKIAWFVSPNFVGKSRLLLFILLLFITTVNQLYIILLGLTSFLTYHNFATCYCYYLNFVDTL